MHPHRRRKKRPNYGTRTVEVSRGHNGFGFTISGQQPCILSCIVPNSPADNAGLRAGNFLIFVNGVNVSKLPHDTVVQLIGNSVGVIHMTIADNYYSDSSDDDLTSNGRQPTNNRSRPKYPHKVKNSRLSKTYQTARNSSAKTNNVDREPTPYQYSQKTDHVDIAESTLNASKSVMYSRLSASSVANVRAFGETSNKHLDLYAERLEPTCSHMGLRNVQKNNCVKDNLKATVSCAASASQYESTYMPVPSQRMLELAIVEKETLVECRAIIGYLGTIEMPKQIATSSKLQTVRSCIRKLRQEKRNPTTVLMTVLPSCMTLKNNSGKLLAEYPCKRINYVSCSSENDYRYFGLVTCATHEVEINHNENGTYSPDANKDNFGIEISNSCHVFMIDPKLIDHSNHASKAEEFGIVCCVDPVSNNCLEFPSNAEYIVNIIRIMYSLKFPNGFSGKNCLDNMSKLTIKSNSPLVNGQNFSRNLNRPPVSRMGRYPRSANRIPINRNEQRLDNGERINQNMLNNNHGDLDNIMYNGNDFMANSPQPSNHSEMTTASSNSDSGIGFHNDCQNMSDRILVVDFSLPQNNFNANLQHNLDNGPCNVNLNRDKMRPSGIAGACAFETDSCFLSNTTPVVEGFGGLGRPLNDHVLTRNIGETSQSHSIYNSSVISMSTKSIDDNQNSIIDHYAPCSSRRIVLNQVSVQRSDINSKVSDTYCLDMPEDTHSTCDYFLKTVCSSESNYPALNVKEIRHYDSVYTENEDHHYEIIKPKTANVEETTYAHVPSLSNICGFAEGVSESKMLHRKVSKGESRSRKSHESMSLENITAASMANYEQANKNASIDDISMYSSKSQDYVSPNAYANNLNKQRLQSSVDDMLIFGLKNANNSVKPTFNDHNFVHPASVKAKFRKSLKPSNFLLKTKQILGAKDDKCKEKYKQSNHDKLSPKVFGVGRHTTGASVESVCETSVATRGGERVNKAVCSDSEEQDWGWGGRHLEGTRSEPDLRAKEKDKQHTDESEHSSPFRRWTATGGGGAGERALSHRSYRRPSSLLAAVSDHDMYAKCDGVTGAGSGGVAAWSLGLERLLADPNGASAFAAFLAKEFSAENIRFWSACEQYACSGGDAATARDIYARHLADGAPEPVNVDAPARAAARERLCEAPADLFAQAQKQVFNLMKFDSYPRFLRSPVHAECARAELCGAPAPYAPPPSTAGTPTPTKLKKSFSNAEERRRGIIPWARLRGGSKDRGQPQTSQPEENSKPQVQVTNNVSPSQSLSLDGPPSRCTLCRVELPDAATTVVALGTGQTVRQLVDRLLEKRGMQCSAYDVFELGCSKPMDVAQSASNLAGKQVRVERRVVFRLELPNRRVVSVRCRPSKPLGAVLRPVLQRYGAAGAGAAAALGVALGGQTLDLTCAVQVADGQRLQVTLNEELAAKFAQQSSQSTNGNAESGHCNNQPSITGETSSSEQVKLKPNLALPSLDEITNRVFEEVLQGKAELQIDKEEGSMKSSNCSSSHSSGIFGHLMRRGCSAPSGTCSVSTDGGAGLPLVAKLRAGVRLQSAGGNIRSGDNAEFLESLRQAQKARLKDKMEMNQTQPKLATIHADSHQTDDAKMQQSMVPPVPAIRNLTNVSSKPAPAVRTILSSKPICNGENSDGQDVNVKPPLSFVNSSYAMTKNLIPNNNAERNGSISDDKTQSVCKKLANNHFETDNNNVSILNGNEKACEETPVNNINSNLSEDFGNVAKRVIDPPPLPPKPKILPTKPSNWGHNLGEPPCVQEVSLPSVDEINTRSKRMIYLDQPTSSFV